MIRSSHSNSGAFGAVGIETQQIAIRKKYYTQMKAALGARVAARFLQVENQMAIFVDLNIASEMPVVGARN